MQDRRVQRTQRALHGALLALSAEKAFSALSVRELTARAGVGYATFFRHYPSKEALLLEVLTDTVDALVERLHPLDEAAETGRRLFAYVTEHRARVRLLASAPQPPDIEAKMQRVVVARLLDTTKLPTNAVVPADLTAQHLVASSTALIRWWLEQATPPSPERMGSIYAAPIVEPVQALALGAAPPAATLKR